MGNYKYDKKNTKLFALKANLTTDADICERLESVGNIQGYIKSLIRADIASGGRLSRPLAVSPAESEESAAE